MKILLNILYVLFTPLMLIWQPLSLIGLIVAAVYGILTFGWGGNVVVWRRGLATTFYFKYIPNTNFSVCFGFIIVHVRSPEALDISAPVEPIEITDKHEYGHSIQAWFWGPLYLFSVGIPSLLHNWRTLASRNILPYYLQYPEDQADVLGGVTRSERTKAGFLPSVKLKA